MFLKRSSEFSSGFHRYTRAFCLPVGQGSTRRRDDAVSIGLGFSSMATRVDTHLYDILGIGLGIHELSAHFRD